MTADLIVQTAGGGKVSHLPRGYRLELPAGGVRGYRLAQLDDYANVMRRAFPHRPSLTLQLRARASAGTIPGTWGFGLWNDPFGAAIGFGGNPLRLPALPNTAWFFHASPENHLTFSDNPGSGFLAQAFSAPAFPLARLARVGLTFPFSRVQARALLGEIVEESGARLDVDVTAWHTYRLEWGPTRTAFWVDEVQLLLAPVSPRPPLGLVLWIDNQYARFTPDGDIGFGVLANTEPAWLEIEGLQWD